MQIAPLLRCTPIDVQNSHRRTFSMATEMLITISFFRSFIHYRTFCAVSCYTAVDVADAAGSVVFSLVRLLYQNVSSLFLSFGELIRIPLKRQFTFSCGNRSHDCNQYGKKNVQWDKAYKAQNTVVQTEIHFTRPFWSANKAIAPDSGFIVSTHLLVIGFVNGQSKLILVDGFCFGVRYDKQNGTTIRTVDSVHSLHIAFNRFSRWQVACRAVIAFPIAAALKMELKCALFVCNIHGASSFHFRRLPNFTMLFLPIVESHNMPCNCSSTVEKKR